MLEYQRGEPGTLTYRDGDRTMDGRVYEHYFTPPETWGETTITVLGRLASLEGPVLDAGCGAGKHVRWLEERDVDVVGIDASPAAVEAARERGVADARVMDMFDTTFQADRFRAVHAFGTQIGLAGSLAGVSDLLAEFARITDRDGLAVVHNYDPADVDEDMLGYRPDPRDGVAHRCFHFEYVPRSEGERSGESDDVGPDAVDLDDADPDAEREIGPTLHFLLFGPDRLADAAVGTPWELETVFEEDGTYRAILEKPR